MNMIAELHYTIKYIASSYEGYLQIKFCRFSHTNPIITPTVENIVLFSST